LYDPLWVRNPTLVDRKLFSLMLFWRAFPSLMNYSQKIFLGWRHLKMVGRWVVDSSARSRHSISPSHQGKRGRSARCLKSASVALAGLFAAIIVWLLLGHCPMGVLEGAIGEPLTKKLDVGKALDKLRGSDEPKARMTVLDEKNKALDEEIRRLRAERRRLERDNPGTRQRD